MIIYLNNGRNTVAGRVISFLRFPLIVLILFIHSNFSTVSGAFAQQTVATAVSQYVSGTIAPVALWAFFFISGMLFSMRAHSRPTSTAANCGAAAARCCCHT